MIASSDISSCHLYLPGISPPRAYDMNPDAIRPSGYSAGNITKTGRHRLFFFCNNEIIMSTTKYENCLRWDEERDEPYLQLPDFPDLRMTAAREDDSDYMVSSPISLGLHLSGSRLVQAL